MQIQIRPPQQYVVDSKGTKTHVVLPLEEYEDLLQGLEQARITRDLAGNSRKMGTTEENP